MTDLERKALIDESLMLERCCSRLKPFLQSLRNEKLQSDKEADQAGDPRDKSFDQLLDMLKPVLEELEERSNRLWAEVSKNRACSNRNWEELANATLNLAAKDYARALCGKDESEIIRIETFAKDQASMFSTVNFTAVLDRIKRTVPTFQKVAAENYEKILNDTPNKDRKGGSWKPVVTCPLCGRGLYVSRGYVRCIGCRMYYKIPHTQKPKGEKAGKNENL